MLGIDLGDRPLFYGGILSVVFGTQLLTTGLLAEVVVRIYFSNKNRPYVIRRILIINLTLFIDNSLLRLHSISYGSVAQLVRAHP